MRNFVEDDSLNVSGPDNGSYNDKIKVREIYTIDHLLIKLKAALIPQFYTLNLNCC